jgi:hypothetical protein
LIRKKNSRKQYVCGYSALLRLVDRNLFPIFAQMLKADSAAGSGKKGIVASAAYVLAGVNVGAALADEDIASQDELAVGTLGTKTLGLGITAVFGGAAALFVSEELQTNLNHNYGPSFL